MFVTVGLITLRERFFFSLNCNGYIDNVTRTLIFSSVCNGWIDNVTGKLFFSLILPVILIMLLERYLLV